MPDIPFWRPSPLGQGLAYLAEAWDRHSSMGGMYSQRCQEYLQQELGCGRALLTTNATSALEMTALLMDLRPGDEVLVPSFTFVSTALHVVTRGARPVWVDARADTGNLDESQLEGLITPRTRGLMAVHYAGVSCAMDTISRITDQHGIWLVEDTAHALFGRYQGRYLGSWGSAAVLSFHQVKPFPCGEGGALLVNHQPWRERAEILWEKGTNRLAFLRGEAPNYQWLDLGSNYGMSDLLAAILWAQIEQREAITRERRRMWSYYFSHLQDWAATQGVGLPVVPPDCEMIPLQFHVTMPSGQDCQGLRQHLANRGIASHAHFPPLHLTPMGRSLEGRQGMCPVAESLSERLLRIPFFLGLNGEEQDRVIEAMQAFTGSIRAAQG